MIAMQNLVLVMWLVTMGTSESDPAGDHYPGSYYDDVKPIPGKPLSSMDFQRAEALGKENGIPSNEVPLEDPIEIAGLYQGDIYIPSFGLKGNSSKNAVAHGSKKWKDGVIPYLISNEYDEKERGVIARGIMEYHRQTCVKFVSRSNEPDYIFISKGKGCSSKVGRLGGVQNVILGDECLRYPGVTIHELMHVIGFWHEQSREDRDEHVTVYLSNVRTGMEYNFNKHKWGYIQNLSAPYDTNSIMHYGPYAFCKDRKHPTIMPNNPNDRMGQRLNFSKIDIMKINKLYQCSDGSLNSLGTESPPELSDKCQNLSKHCTYWQRKGECEKNPEWMSINCPLSCGTCCKAREDCTDQNRNCESWRDSGECQINSEYMRKYCPKSCSMCLPKEDTSTVSPILNGCKDQHRHCKYWASQGECHNNEPYMSRQCRRSCKLCQIKTAELFSNDLLE